MLFRPSHSSYVLGIIFTLLIDPLCLHRGCSLVGRTFLITPRSICTALLTPTCSLPCRYSISIQVVLCRSSGLFSVMEVLQIEACLSSSCPLGYLFFIDDALSMFFAFGNVCAGWFDAFNGKFSLPVVFHIATQTAPKLLPSSLPGAGRRLRGVDNAERSLSHSRYHCSVLLRSGHLLSLLIAGGFRTLAFWTSLYQEVHRFRFCAPVLCRAALPVNCPS